MALDLGELAAHLVVDDQRWSFDGALKSLDQFGDRAKASAKTAGDQAGDAFGDSLVPEAERAGEEAGEKAGDGLKAKVVLGAGAAGAAVGAAFVEALDLDAAQDKLVASLGANQRQADRYGRVAGNLYANAWGDSMDQVNESIGHVVRNIGGMRVAARKDLEDVTAGVLDVVTAFDQDLAMTTAAVGQLMRTGMAKDARDALDIITVGLQGPANKADDLLETFNEYGTQFRKLGIDGRDAVLLLGQGLRGGARDADIVADSLKEFSLRAVGELTKTMQTSDGPVASLTALGEAFRAAGYDALDADPKVADLASRLQEDIAGGGDKARAGLQILLEGLRDTENPLERTRHAVSLFGTQAEDMGDALYEMDLPKRSDEVDKFTDASRKMSDQLNGNSRTSITEFTRTLKSEFVGYLEDKVIPVVEDDVIPAVRRFGNWFEDEGGPALRDFKDDLDPVIDAVGDLAGFLNDLPGEAKIAALGGALAGGVVVKHKLAGIFDRGGPGNPMYVRVTNPGVGTGGDDGLVVTDDGGDGKRKKPKKRTGGRTGGILGLLAGLFGPEIVDEAEATAKYPWSKEADLPPLTTDSVPVWSDRTAAANEIDGLTAKVNGFQDALDLAGSTKVHPDLAVPGLRRESQFLSDFIDLQIEAGKPVYSAIFLTGVERAMGQIASLNAGLDGFGERGVDNGVPFVHGGSRGAGDGRDLPSNPRAGVNVIIHGDVRPADSREFYQDMQQRSRRRGHGGFGG